MQVGTAADRKRVTRSRIAGALFMFAWGMIFFAPEIRTALNLSFRIVIWTAVGLLLVSAIMYAPLLLEKFKRMNSGER